MCRCIILTGALLAIFATAAAAQSGNGLYKPYPAGITPTSAESYYARLGRPLTAAQLAGGVFISPRLAGSRSAGPSERAGAIAAGIGLWELVAAIAVAVVGVAVAAGRRASPPASTRPAAR
jgi:hypothetical protein